MGSLGDKAPPSFPCEAYGAHRGASLVMPVYNEAKDISDVLASIAAQTYPHEALYLIVVDGESSDGCADLVRQWLSESNIAGVVVTNPLRKIPTSLNVGLAHARPDDIIIRFDAHTTYDSAYVQLIMETFAQMGDDVGCVGGSQIPAPVEGFSKRVAYALYTNPLGLGSGAHRANGKPRPANSVYLGAWRPQVFRAIGGFDPRWEANEDGEFAARIRRAGFSTFFVPVRSAYRIKRGPLAEIRQWGRYGFWRGRTLRVYPTEIRVRHLIPPLALVLGLGLVVAPAWPLVLLLLVVYAVAIFAKRAPGEPFGVTLLCCVVFPATQVAWTIGLIRGMLAPRLRNPEDQIAVGAFTE
jgi:succinoglycan biosynthesis protein ExoA